MTHRAGKANINTADFDPAKCTNNVAQAEFVNGLGRLLGLVPGQIKITSTVGWYALVVRLWLILYIRTVTIHTAFMGAFMGKLNNAMAFTRSNQRRQADGGQVEWQFITPCGVKAQQLYQEQLDAGGKNPITRYLAANDVVKVWSIAPIACARYPLIEMWCQL